MTNKPGRTDQRKNQPKYEVIWGLTQPGAKGFEYQCYGGYRLFFNKKEIPMIDALIISILRS